MKKEKIILIVSSVLLTLCTSAFSQSITDYYLKGTGQYDEAIPSPEKFLGYKVGEWHVSHDQIVSYFTMLSQKSPRVKYETYGRTHEGRPLTLAIISSEENIKNIEEIRNKHLQICDPAVSANINFADQPVVVWLSHSIHGNEASGANSSMITAWHFAAAKGKEIEDILKSTIILIDPSTNPDGMQRFSGWVNSHKSKMINTDPLSREHLEVWPGSRSNHYWFDLNRDWLPVEQPESENRIRMLHLWMPAVLVDLHEQGSNATFHFSPGEPKRVNPLIPEENQRLTKMLAADYAKAYDAIGSLYFSGEQYDDYYIGRGPTYMDMNGGVSLLFEQASSRGFAQNTDNGLLTFPFAIKNQLTGALSTISTAYRMKDEFLSYQRNYYTTALQDARKSLKKAYVFGSDQDRTTTFRMAKLLDIHGVNSYLLNKDVSSGKKTFKAGKAYIVPLDQAQYRLIESIFEVRTTFQDSIFYDVSAWNMPMAYNLPFDVLDARNFTTDLKGEAYTESQAPVGKMTEENAYAYAINWADYNSPAALYKLLSSGIIVKVVTLPMETGDGKKFDRGTLIIPMGTINSDKALVKKVLNEVAGKYGLEIIALQTGENPKTDLGSPSLVKLEKPEILILTEEGVNGFSAGQLWHLFDTRYDIPVTLLPSRLLSSVNLYNYNVLIIPDGSYQNIDDKTVEKIQSWTAAGNTVIGLERASQWLAKSKFMNVEFKPGRDDNSATSYEGRLLYSASREVPGTIFEMIADLTHPLFYGYQDDHIPLYKDNDIIQNVKEMNPINNPSRYAPSPLLDGYSPKGFSANISGTPVCAVFPIRQGKVFAFYNNPVFRGYWRGSNRMLANAIFFGKVIRFSTGREQ